MEKEKWVLCPICNNKTRIKVRPDTVLENFPLYCPKCKQETIINVTGQNVVAIKTSESKYQIKYISYHRARRIDAEPIITRNKSYDYWLFLFCDRKTNRHFLYIKWNSGKYTIIFIDMAVSGDIAMFLFHIFNSIPLLKKAYSMQRSFATIEMNTQIIIIA